MQSLQPPMKSGEVAHIGRYRILDILGKGAMAIVYKAYDPNIDRTLAIKVLREEKCIDPEYRERFLREARAAGNLSHPNIVTVYDVGEFNDRPYIVMEIVEGKPLDKVMKSSKHLSLPNILSITIQLAKALDYSHKNGVVHRDIKPSNIIYPAKGNTIKITDFGIAHLENTELTQQTQIGEVLGTPQYMSPEQVLGQPVDGRSDLFSVGVVLYQMVSGQKPFVGDTIASLLFQIATEEPKPLDRVAKNIPITLRQIIEKLLQKQPSKRFQSGMELSRMLMRMVQDDNGEQAETQRMVPMRVKWTFIMSFLVGSVLLAGLFLIYQRQYQAILDQAVDYGGSLAQFIASESAIPLLEGDLVAISVIVSVAQQRNATDRQSNPAISSDGGTKKPTKKNDIQYITIVDRNNIVRGHINPARVGQQFRKPTRGKKIVTYDEFEVIDYTLANLERVFEFASPIKLDNTRLGQVRIGISQAPLQDVVNTTIMMMLALMVAVISAVGVIAYVIGLSLARPMSVLKRSMFDVTNGHRETRILDHRTDEFGQLFQAFNRMMEALQQREKNKDPDPDDTTFF